MWVSLVLCSWTFLKWGTFALQNLLKVSYECFKHQTQFLLSYRVHKSIITNNHYKKLIGDFNLDYNQKSNPNYSHARYFNLLNDLLLEKQLIQLVKFNTWERLVQNMYLKVNLKYIHVLYMIAYNNWIKTTWWQLYRKK